MSRSILVGHAANAYEDEEKALLVCSGKIVFVHADSCGNSYCDVLLENGNIVTAMMCHIKLDTMIEE